MKRLIGVVDAVFRAGIILVDKRGPLLLLPVLAVPGVQASARRQ